MTLTEPETEAAPPNDGFQLSLGWIPAGIAVFAACALVWGVLFAAYGTAEGDGESTKELTDTFERSVDSGLGSPDTGPSWQAGAGEWAVRENGAAVTTPGKDGWSLATVDLGSNEARISARAATVGPGWGLTFRYQDAKNFWYVSVADASGSLHLGLVEDGITEDLGEVGASLATGSVLDVQIDNHDISVHLDGKFVVLRSDERLGSETAVGLLLGGNDTSSRWDDVAGGPLPAPTIIVPANGQP